MQQGSRAPEVQATPTRASPRVNRPGVRVGGQQIPASARASALSPVASSPARSFSSSPRGRAPPLDAHRVFSEDEELQLKAKGEKERKLADAKELRWRQQEEKRLDTDRARFAREAGEAQRKELQHRLAEEERKRRILEIDERREKEVRRAQERSAQREADLQTPRESWAPPQRVCQRSLSMSELDSREEMVRQREQKNFLTGIKERQAVEVKVCKQREKQRRLAEHEKVQLEHQAKLSMIEAERERKRQQEVLKRQIRKEELDARRERRLKQKENQLQEAKAKALMEFQQRERKLYAKQREELRQATENLEAKGDHERIVRDAQDTRLAQRDLVRSSEQKVRTEQEAREAFLQETKEQQQQHEKIRRALDIDLRRERAEEARREREEAKRQEEELHSQLIFPELPTARGTRSPGPLSARLEEALAARTVIRSRSEGPLLGASSTYLM